VSPDVLGGTSQQQAAPLLKTRPRRASSLGGNVANAAYDHKQFLRGGRHGVGGDWPSERSRTERSAGGGFKQQRAQANEGGVGPSRGRRELGTIKASALPRCWNGRSPRPKRCDRVVPIEGTALSRVKTRSRGIPARAAPQCGTAAGWGPTRPDPSLPRERGPCL